MLSVSGELYCLKYYVSGMKFLLFGLHFHLENNMNAMAIL